MARQDLSAIPNREPLRRLASGLEIARARKHEPIDFSRLNRNQIERLTDKRFGSKFLPEWTLERLTDWIQEQVELQHWTPQSGRASISTLRFQNPWAIPAASWRIQSG
ncbi:MAG TPA: hypothetical protein VGM03_17975 [Phycisphaerae bacterium]|jgi:hypothetical protein